MRNVVLGLMILFLVSACHKAVAPVSPQSSAPLALTPELRAFIETQTRALPAGNACADLPRMMEKISKLERELEDYKKLLDERAKAERLRQAARDAKDKLRFSSEEKLRFLREKEAQNLKHSILAACAQTGATPK